MDEYGYGGEGLGGIWDTLKQAGEAAVIPVITTIAGEIFPQSDPYNPPTQGYDFRSAAERAAAAARASLLQTGGEYIAQTPEGQEALKREARAEMMKMLLPIGIGVSVLFLVMRK